MAWAFSINAIPAVHFNLPRKASGFSFPSGLNPNHFCEKFEF
jgi:membrane-associated phospholipid phosphatase